MNASPRVGIDHLTLLDISPPELVTIAGEVGFDSVGLRVAAATPGEEPWPMAVGSSMLEKPSAGQTIPVSERWPSRLSASDQRPDEKITRVRAAGGSPVGSELRNGQRRRPGYRTGVRYLRNPNRRRKALWPAAPDRADYLPQVSNLDEAVYIAERSDGGGILLDSLHFQRYDGSFEHLRSVNPGLLAYAQLNDAPLQPPTNPTPQQATSRAIYGRQRFATREPGHATVARRW